MGAMGAISWMRTCGCGAMALPSADALPSTGDVFSTRIAALYAFFAAGTFEEGALLCVNMSDDADTVGAVYGGLAGC